MISADKTAGTNSKKWPIVTSSPNLTLCENGWGFLPPPYPPTQGDSARGELEGAGERGRADVAERQGELVYGMRANAALLKAEMAAYHEEARGGEGFVAAVLSAAKEEQEAYVKRAEGTAQSPQEKEVQEGRRRANQPMGKSVPFRYGSDAADEFW